MRDGLAAAVVQDREIVLREVVDVSPLLVAHGAEQVHQADIHADDGGVPLRVEVDLRRRRAGQQERQDGAPDLAINGHFRISYWIVH